MLTTATQDIKTLYEGRILYPITFISIRHGLPCNCMCSKDRTLKKMSRVNVAILKAIHKNRPRVLRALKDKKVYFAEILQNYIEHEEEQKTNAKT
jgi:hypothetical protein